MGRIRQIACGMWERMKQRKHVDMDDTSTRLRRCLTLKRLVFIGIGKTVGVGIYVLIGVATKDAGPSIILAFVIAFVVTLLNGLCFAEYASKNPHTGAQYTYMYETIGQAVAFLVGWTNVIGFTAAFSMGARGWSGYVDSLFNNAIENYTMSYIANWTSRGPPFPEYPDIPAILIILVVMVIASVGVKFASLVNSILTAVAVGLLIFIALCGFFYSNSDNWLKTPGGFFPNGFNGVLKASSSCFYAFQGFEILGYSAEETVNPKKDVPRSIVIVLVIVTILYLSVAVSFTLMIPYTVVNTNAPFPSAFEYNSVAWAKYIVEIGPILALTNLCVLELFTIQRLSFSMSEDGLLFKFLSHVNQYTKVPLGPVLAFGPIVIILVLSIDLSNLIGFMVIYTFIQYSVFAAYLIILRYVPSNTRKNDKIIAENISNSDQKFFAVESKPHTCFSWHLSNFLSVKRIVIFIYFLLFILSLLIVKNGTAVLHGNSVSIICIILLCGLIAIATVWILCQEQKGDCRGYLVPLMPVLPLMSMFFNLLMLVATIDKGSLVASIVMAVIGVVVYLCIVAYDAAKNLNSGSVEEAGDTAELLGDEHEDEDETSQ